MFASIIACLSVTANQDVSLARAARAARASCQVVVVQDGEAPEGEAATCPSD